MVGAWIWFGETGSRQFIHAETTQARPVRIGSARKPRDGVWLWIAVRVGDCISHGHD